MTTKGAGRSQDFMLGGGHIKNASFCLLQNWICIGHREDRKTVCKLCVNRTASGCPIHVLF